MAQKLANGQLSSPSSPGPKQSIALRGIPDLRSLALLLHSSTPLSHLSRVEIGSGFDYEACPVHISLFLLDLPYKQPGSQSSTAGKHSAQEPGQEPGQQHLKTCSHTNKQQHKSANSGAGRKSHGSQKHSLERLNLNFISISGLSKFTVGGAFTSLHR